MNVPTYWGVSPPVVCQLCQRPVQRWEYAVTINPRAWPRVERRGVVFAAVCHGAVEVRMYPIEDDAWVDGLHPLTAFPMPS